MTPYEGSFGVAHLQSGAGDNAATHGCVLHPYDIAAGIKCCFGALRAVDVPQLDLRPGAC